MGLLLCYGALFLYETEHRLIQSRLEELWVHIDDMQKMTVRRHIAFLRVAAGTASRFLDRLLGEYFVSLRAFTVTACFSLISMIVVSSVGVRFFARHGLLTTVQAQTIPRFLSFLINAAEGATVFANTSSGLLLQPHGVAQTGILSASILAIIAQFLSPRLRLLPALVIATFLGISSIATPWLSIIVLAAIFLGVVCDVLAIAVVRICLRRQAKIRSTASIIAMTLAELAVGTALMLAPLTSLNWLDTSSEVGAGLSIGYAAAFTSNGGSVALSFAFVIAAFTLGLHRLIWPIIARPLYLLADLRLFASRKTRAAVLAIGVALIAFSVGKASEVLSAFQALFGAG